MFFTSNLFCLVLFSQPSSLSVAICIEYLLQSFHFQPICALVSKWSLLICLSKTHFVNIRYLISEFNPFAFKVVIDNEGFFFCHCAIHFLYAITVSFLTSSNTAFFCVWRLLFFFFTNAPFWFLFHFLLFIFLMVTMGIVINILHL